MNKTYLSLKKYIKKAIYGSGTDIILKSIEEQKGKLDPKLKKISNEYAHDVLGSLRHAKHLYIYCAIQNKFREGWIPESYYFNVVLPKKKGAYAKLGSLNCLQSVLLGNKYFPDVGYLMNNQLFTPEYNMINCKEFVNNVLTDDDKVVFKPDNSARGEGIKILKCDKISEAYISNLADGVFQSYIKQHPFFNQFVSNSVATIRLTTIVDHHSEISLVGAYLRIGRIFDSHIKSTNAIKIPIKLSKGELNSVGYQADWKYIFKHPDTGVEFESKIIPDFRKCVNLSIELHKKVPYVNCIGWDMIVGENNEAIPIEWNGYNNDIKFTEALFGPCFSNMKWEQLWRNNM